MGLLLSNLANEPIMFDGVVLFLGASMAIGIAVVAPIVLA